MSNAVDEWLKTREAKLMEIEKRVEKANGIDLLKDMMTETQWLIAEIRLAWVQLKISKEALHKIIDPDHLHSDIYTRWCCAVERAQEALTKIEDGK